MNTIHLSLNLCLALSLVAGADPAADNPIQTGTGHRFACADYSGKKVFIVGRDGRVEWEYPAGTCNDLWVLPGGNLLFNTGRGVKEVTRDKEVVFEYQSEGEVYACQRLANGNTFVGECTLGRLLEVQPDGTIVKSIDLLPEGRKGDHTTIRNARVLENGHYLVCHYGEGVVREYDGSGRLLREIPAPSGPHSAARLANGNTIIAEGDRTKEPRIREVDGRGETVWSIGKNELPGIEFKFLTGFQRLENGNTVITNWVGHGQFGKAPHIIEVTRDKQVVWTFQDHETMRTVSSIQLLDEPGDAIRFGIIH